MTSAPADPGPFIAPFRQLIHNIHQFGEHWLWRCGVAYSRLDPGYVDGACRYDHTVDSWEQLVADATEHLRRWHGITSAEPSTTAPAAIPSTRKKDT